MRSPSTSRGRGWLRRVRAILARQGRRAGGESLAAAASLVEPAPLLAEERAEDESDPDGEPVPERRPDDLGTN